MGDAAEAPKANKVTQIIGAIAATMGGFTLGTVIGWSSPAQDILIDEGITESEFTHISSIMCLGAASSQLYIFLTFDRVGRKWTMIIIAIPAIIVWCLMAFVGNVYVYLIGRFIVGFSGGAFCVAAPTYIGEYAEKSIRGALGIMFQLMLVTGIMCSFAIGLFSNRMALCLPLAAAPAINVIMMLFLPDSPTFLKMKQKDEKAMKSLQFFRGKNFDIKPDMKEIEDYLKAGEGSFKENIKKRSTITAFLMLLVLHVVQQLCGINAIMFYAGNIFKAGSFFGLASDVCTCIIGVVQILTCLVAAFLIDKVGRKMLWLISLGIMAVALIVVGIYYIIKVYDETLSKKMEFMLVIMICLYIIGFCFGAGPLPWSMFAEMLAPVAKTSTAPVITAINWLLGYAVTSSFPHLDKAVGAGPVFLAYGVVCILGFLFVLFILIETKGKTLDEIQTELGEKKT